MFNFMMTDRKPRMTGHMNVRTGIYISGISLLLGFALWLSSCAPQQSHRLAVVFPENFPYYLLEKAYFTENGDEVVESASKFDTIQHRGIYYCDSIGKGNYTFNLKTIFRQPIALNIALASDTSIQIDSPFKTKAFISKAELSTADTIELIYLSIGCYQHYYEKTMLIARNGTYFLETKSNTYRFDTPGLDIQKTVPAHIIDGLFKLESDLKDAGERSGLADISVSTTTKRVFFRCGKKYYWVNEPVREEDSFYSKFKAAYIESAG